MLVSIPFAPSTRGWVSAIRIKREKSICLGYSTNQICGTLSHEGKGCRGALNAADFCASPQDSLFQTEVELCNYHARCRVRRLESAHVARVLLVFGNLRGSFCCYERFPASSGDFLAPRHSLF